MHNKYFDFMSKTPNSEFFVVYTSNEIERFLQFICLNLYSFQIPPAEFAKEFGDELLSTYETLKNYIQGTLF